VVASAGSGAADRPGTGAARRLTDVRDISDTTTHGGRPTGAVGDEQGEVTA
jgi:hypothetical protein